MRKLFTYLFLLLSQVLTLTSAQFNWKPLDEPAGGLTNYLYAKGDTLFTFSNREIYISSNRGDSWNKILSSRKVSGLVHTDDGGFMGKCYDNGYYGLIKSYDLKNWVKILSGGCYEIIRDVYGNIYASIDSTLYRSSDNGVSWGKYFSLHSTFYDSKILVNDKYLYIFSKAKLYRKKINSPDPVKVIPMPPYFNYSMSVNNSGVIYIVSPYVSPRINYSTNDGDTWAAIMPDSIHPGLKPAEVICTETSVLISNTDTLGITLFKGNIDGTRWVPFSNGIPPMINLKLVASGNYFYANAEGYGILRNDNMTAAWEPAFKGISEVVFNKIIEGNDNTWYAATSGKGVIKSTNRGLTWSDCNNGLMDNTAASIAQTTDGDLFVSSYYYIYRSTDQGHSWKKISKPGYMNNGKVALYSDYRNNLYFHNYYDNVYVSYDKGVTWKVYLRMKTPGGMNITKDGSIYVTINDMKPIALKTSNNGVSWVMLYHDPDYNVRYGDPVVDKFGNIFIAGETKMIRSLDGGFTWKIIKRDFLNNIIKRVYSDDNGRLFCSTNFEFWEIPPVFYYSDDHGENWSDVTGMLPGVEVNGMIDHDGQYLLATSGGLWVNTNEISAVNGNDIKPSSFTLQQNYPNPFNPSTKIEYSIPDEGLVQLIIYDVLGREVAAPLHEYKKAGRYSINFNAAGLNSGVYLYILQWRVNTNIKKMLFIK